MNGEDRAIMIRTILAYVADKLGPSHGLTEQQVDRLNAVQDKLIVYIQGRTFPERPVIDALTDLAEKLVNELPITH